MMLFVAVVCAIAVLTDAQSCGRPSFYSGRVIGGTTARKGSWPWQILLLTNGRPGCGGSIIHPNWVLTASHCIQDPRSGRNISPGSLTVRVGEHNTRLREGTEQDIRVSRVFAHPRFSFRTMMSDVALLKLSRPISFNRYVQPVCMPTAPARVGDSCYITGWGRINRYRQNMHTVLQQARMPVVDTQKCAYHMRRVAQFPIGAHNVCSGYGNARISGCQGDSGGPFVCQSGGKWYLHGAVSWGSKDCSSRRNEYTVYANVYNLKSWIENTMRY